MWDKSIKSNTKSKINLMLWTAFSMGIGLVLIFIVSFVFSSTTFPFKLSGTTGAVSIKTLSGEEKLSTKPKYYYFTKDSEKKLQISASAYLVGDLNTGEIIISKNQDKKLPIASISKLMTALVSTEIIDGDNTAIVSKQALATYGTNGNLRAGEKIKTPDLLYPLLLESSNDAAEVIAEHFGRETFITKMNRQASILKMSDTSYGDPSGLSPENQSSAADVFKLVGYLNKERPDLLQITTKRSFSDKKHSWSNISKFLHRDGYLGGKSGYTDAAKQTVVSLFSLPLGKTGDRPIAITLLGSNDRNKDVGKILQYLQQNIYYGGAADANTNWIAEKIAAPEIRDPDFLRLTFAGDIMLDRGVRSSVIKNFNNDYSALFENLDLLKKSDIVFANLEGTASDKGADGGSLYSFRMDPAVIPALAGAGVNILSVANNHVGDWGRASYVDTLERLKENEIIYTGGGSNSAEAEKVAIVEKYGMKIGFLAFSDKGPDSMVATADKAGLLIASNPRSSEIIKNASEQVDYLVVSFHFGEEYQAKHNDRQEYLAHRAVDNGAKLVIGHHPHVVEDTEVYSPKDCIESSCVGFIAYSLGNFIFDQSWSKPTMEGMVLQVKLNRDGNMSVWKDTVKLNSAFQPEKLIPGREEKLIFEEVGAIQ